MSNDTAAPLWVPKKKKKKALFTIRPLLIKTNLMPRVFSVNPAVDFGEASPVCDVGNIFAKIRYGQVVEREGAGV